MGTAKLSPQRLPGVSSYNFLPAWELHTQVNVIAWSWTLDSEPWADCWDCTQARCLKGQRRSTQSSGAGTGPLQKYEMGLRKHQSLMKLQGLSPNAQASNVLVSGNCHLPSLTPQRTIRAGFTDGDMPEGAQPLTTWLGPHSDPRLELCGGRLQGHPKETTPC